MGSKPGNNSISEFNGSTGKAISGSSGYTGGGLSSPISVAIDNGSNSSITEFIGSAAPVITPIVGGLSATPSADGTSKLGTRP